MKVYPVIRLAIFTGKMLKQLSINWENVLGLVVLSIERCYTTFKEYVAEPTGMNMFFDEIALHDMPQLTQNTIFFFSNLIC